MNQATVDTQWMEQEATRALALLMPRLETQVPLSTPEWAPFRERLEQHFPRLFALLYRLYHHQFDFFYHLEGTLLMAARMWQERSGELKTLDATRNTNPDWFHHQKMVAGVCYVDLFADTLEGVRQKIPYFQELGLTYLHLMPLFRAPEGNSDGGYAVSSYRDVNPALGTTEELKELATELRHAGISLALDFIFNHTSNEHEWANRAIAGDSEYERYYLMYPNRELPDAYERTVREIFPDEHPGAFSYREDIGKWVWTTFHTFQWDLNYSNPAVFTAMGEELLAIANIGVEVIRLDAVAFIWKQMGTTSENLPEAHLLIQAFNALMQIAAPSLLFKSEAIVHPDDVVKYIHPEECQLSYNPLIMALLWNSLATRKVRLLSQAIQNRLAIHPKCAWVNYVRVHDDIGWTFSDDDARILGINGYDHRQFLNKFYTGRYPDTFARGVPFQENPRTGDCRISGTCASLAGLEKALTDGDEQEITLAIGRILVLHSVILSLGGVPLIYLGDEVGMLNDYSYLEDHDKAEDSRWVHRTKTNWEWVEQRSDPESVQGRIYQGIHRMIEIRKAQPAFATTGGVHAKAVNTGNVHVLVYLRPHPTTQILVVANFSEETQEVQWGGFPAMHDLLTGVAADPLHLKLEPYQVLWLQ